MKIRTDMHLHTHLVPTLHWFLRRLCSQMDLPPHCLQRDLPRPCSHIACPPIIATASCTTGVSAARAVVSLPGWLFILIYSHTTQKEINSCIRSNGRRAHKPQVHACGAWVYIKHIQTTKNHQEGTCILCKCLSACRAHRGSN